MAYIFSMRHFPEVLESSEPMADSNSWHSGTDRYGNDVASYMGQPL